MSAARREFHADTEQEAEEIAERWIIKGWHGSAQVQRTSGPGTDLYGPYLGVWSGKVRYGVAWDWCTVTVRPRARGGE